MANYLPILLAFGLGCVAILLSARCARNGCIWNSFGEPVERGKNPISFWINVSLAFGVGAAFVGFAVYFGYRTAVH